MLSNLTTSHGYTIDGKCRHKFVKQAGIFLKCCWHSNYPCFVFIFFLTVLVTFGCDPGDDSRSSDDNTPTDANEEYNTPTGIGAGSSISNTRFTDIGDGTVRDNDTGLIWLKDANAFGTINWDDAMEAAVNLSDGEHGLTDGSFDGDWRLPTKEEWEEFVDRSYYRPPLCNTEGNGQWAEGDPFIGVQTVYPDSRTPTWCTLYWSSTQYNDDFAGACRLGCDGVVRARIPKDMDTLCLWPVRFDTWGSQDSITFEPSPGTTVSNFQFINNPSPADVPSNVDFPYGFFIFTIEGVEPGGSTSITITLPAGASPPRSFFKYGTTPDNPSNLWYEFIYDGETGATIEGNIITLYFIDGKNGDSDLDNTNGTIIAEPGGPAVPE